MSEMKDKVIFIAKCGYKIWVKDSYIYKILI
jgi:hypothetical protein